MEEKNALRRQMKAEREGWEAEYRQGADVAIAHHVRKSAVWRAAGTVFAYVSVDCEVDTRALIETALQEGKRVCAPRCLGKGAHGGTRGRIAGRARTRRLRLLEPAEDAPSCRRKRSTSYSFPALPLTETAIASATAAVTTTVFGKRSKAVHLSLPQAGAA